MSRDQPSLFDPVPDPPPPAYDPEDFPFFHGPRSMADAGFIDASWIPVLEQVAGRLREIALELSARSRAGERILPDPKLMLRALTLPVDRVKVLLVGQDPYPTPGHPIGLCFATNAKVRPLPRSLVNIYRELHSDLGIEPAEHGDLSAWLGQGVLLLNQVFSVSAGMPASHQKLGWTALTEAIVDRLNEGKPPVVAVLWGAHAQKLAVRMDRMVQLKSAHPSPLSASRGFFGSRPFSTVNRELAGLGQEPVRWALPPAG